MLVIDGDNRGSLGASDETMHVVEDLQFTLGEGPCIDAWRTGRPVHEPDLARVQASLWPAFAPPAVAAGVAAVFAFPLLSSGICLGVLDLYEGQPGPLVEFSSGGAFHRRARVLGGAGRPGRGCAGHLSPERGVVVRAVVHQAAGMVAVQVGADVADALVRLRAHAYRTDRPLVDVAADVVARRLRFEGDRC